jgi:hypothetical protein
MGPTVKPGVATTKFSRLTGLATIRNIAPPTTSRHHRAIGVTIVHTAAPTMRGAILARLLNNSSELGAYHVRGNSGKMGQKFFTIGRLPCGAPSLARLATIRHNSPPTMAGLPLATHHRNSLQLVAYHARGRVSRVSQQFFTTVLRSGLRCNLRYNGLAIGIKVYRAIQRFFDRDCGLKLDEQRYRHMRICA